MAVAQADTPLKLLTYEQYMAEGEINKRYDIIDGERFVTNPTRRHQRILQNMLQPFEDYSRVSRAGQAIVAPCDVLIYRRPLRTRQPDILFISNERLAQNPPAEDPTPLSPAPELAVEIVSPSDTRAVLAAKLADYQRVNVQECWVVYSGTLTVEILLLTQTQITLDATYSAGQIVHSVVFPGLAVAVDAIFAA